MNEKYNYLVSVMEDVRQFINENYTLGEMIEECEDKEAFFDKLYDECLMSDSVTGNASGSYYCNSWKAEDALCHNMDLLEEVCEYFDGDMGELIKRGAEYCDVAIRCYILQPAIINILRSME